MKAEGTVVAPTCYFVHDFFSLFFSVKKAFQKTKALIRIQTAETGIV
jgi:hypothetical protein